MKGLGQRLVERFSRLESERSNYENIWQVLADYVLPNRMDFTIERSDAQVKNRPIYDSTAIHANQLLASTLHSGITNASSNWFDLSTDVTIDMSPDVKSYLHIFKEKLQHVFNSNEGQFQSQVFEFYSSLVCFGTAIMFVELDDESQIRFSTIHLSEIFINEDKYNAVDTVFRKFKLTIRQAAQMWGEEKLHAHMGKLLEMEPDKEAEFLHMVAPARDVPHTKDVFKKFPISSVYIDLKNKHVLDQKGFYEMPYIVSRFDKLAGEKYGRSPAWNALSDIRMINAMSKSIIRSAQLQTAPPLLVADDGVMMPIELKPNGIIAGGINSMDGGQRVTPLNVGGNLGIGVELLQQRQASIRNAYFIDQLMFREGTPATATEVVQRQEEKLRLLAPHLGRLQTEFLTPLMKRVAGILFRMNILPEAPAEIKMSKADIKVDYKSPLIRLQKANEITSLAQFIQSIGPLIQVAPESIDKLNIDAVLDVIAEATGLHISALRPDEEVQALRQQRQQQQAAMMALENAESISKANQNLTETDRNDT